MEPTESRRHLPPVHDPDDSVPDPDAVASALGRFTSSAADALATARAEARCLHHGYVGTAHLLVALAQIDGSAAARVLSALDRSAADLRATVGFIEGPGEDDHADDTPLPLSPRLQRVIIRAAAEADRQGQQSISTLYLLKGLLSERTGVAVSLLHSPGVGLERAGAQVQRATRDGLSDEPAPRP